MMRPQPDCWFEVTLSTLAGPSVWAFGGVVNWLAFLMKRRNTVSVTPAIGASTVAGARWTLPMVKESGNPRAAAEAPFSSGGESALRGLSQNFCTVRFYFLFPGHTPPVLEAPRRGGF